MTDGYYFPPPLSISFSDQQHKLLVQHVHKTSALLYMYYMYILPVGTELVTDGYS